MKHSFAFQPFKVHAAWDQGREACRLVTANPSLEESFYAGALERYTSYPKAVRNIIRLAVMPGFTAGLIREATEVNKLDEVHFGAAVGMGTLIAAAVRHPGEDVIVKGIDVDFWLDQTLHEDPEAQAAAAHALLVPARKLLAEGSANDHVFATIIPDAPRQPEGLVAGMEAVGFPRQLELINSQGDPYGVVKNGATLQLYAENYSIGHHA